MSVDSWGIWLTVAIAGTAANDIWRMAGAWLSRGADPQSPVMLWVKDVSTALVAALICAEAMFFAAHWALSPSS